ncbi:MAG: hypothetical protein ACRDWG_07525 [Actinomycetes bacterium]
MSGTPPVEMLDHPNVVQVAGDATAGFYRRWWPVRPQPPEEYDGDSDDLRQEGYSWGALTAGSRVRALWLLLLPFMLANIAFFMIPRSSAGGRRWDSVWWLRKSSEAVQRVFSLGLTLMLVLTAVSVSMDMVAWQCTRPGSEGCSGTASWLGFLTEGFFAQPSRRLALAAVVPLAAIGVLRWLSRSTWSNYEAKLPPPRESDAGSVQSRLPAAASERSTLEQRKLWNGAGPVKRLAAVHITAGIALTGVLLVAPIADGGSWEAVLQLLLAALLVLLLGSVLLAILPVTATRHNPGRSTLSQWQQAIYSALPVLAIALVLVAGTIALLPGVGPESTVAVDGTRVLPWFGALFGAVVIGMALAWLLVAALTIPLAASGRGEPIETAGARDGDLYVAPAWWGLGTPVALMLGWLVAGGFSAGLTLLVAGWLGDPVPAGQDRDAAMALSLPPYYFWAAIGAGVMLLLVAAGITAGIWRFRVRYRQLLKERIPRLYQSWLPPNGSLPTREAERRAQAIARSWARANVAEIGRAVFGSLTVAILLVLFGGLVLYLLPAGRSAVEDSVPGWLVGWCVTLIVVATAALIGLGRAAYKDRNKRRTLGTLWDVGTFWPRATHPLAPPSYGERAMPDLIRRIGYLTDKPDDVVILSAHSQGAIIAATVFLQLDPVQQNRVCLLTYGCPLRRLYARFFPAFFGLRTLRRLGQLLDRTEPQPHALPRAGWAWRNLFRPSDYIGGPVFNAYPEAQFDPQRDLAGGDNGDVDRELIDPVFISAAGDLTWPAPRGHSNYWADPAFADSRQLVLTLHRARTGTPRSSEPDESVSPESPMSLD